MEQGPHDKDSEKEADGAAEQPLPNPPIVQARMEGEQKQERTQATKTKDEGMKPNRPLSTWADIFQVCIQSILVGGALFGLYIYDGQLKEARRSNDLLASSTAIAIRAADASDKAIQLSRLDQRAWIASTGATGKPEEGKPLPVTVILKNGGKTFGKQVRIRGCLRLLPNGTEPDYAKQIAAVTPTSAGVMPPGGDYFSESPGKAIVTKSYIEDLQEGRTVLFVFGEISYLDIFNCAHWTRFCYRLKPETWSWIIYATGNDTDEEDCSGR